MEPVEIKTCINCVPRAGSHLVYRLFSPVRFVNNNVLKQQRDQFSCITSPVWSSKEIKGVDLSIVEKKTRNTSRTSGIKAWWAGYLGQGGIWHKTKSSASDKVQLFHLLAHFLSSFNHKLWPCSDLVSKSILRNKKKPHQQWLTCDEMMCSGSYLLR